jgi:hypothetical protein
MTARIINFTQNKNKMRKIILLTVIVIMSMGANAQGFLRDRSRVQTFALTANDTMRIWADDRIAGVTIIVPASATDSVWIIGEHATLDGNTYGYVKIAPGDDIGLGYDDKLKLDSVMIVVKNKAYIITIPMKR